MPPADPGLPAPVPAPEEADDFDEATRIVKRTSDQHTRIVARRPRASRPVGAAAPVAPNDGANPTDEETVHSSRRSTTNDTLRSGRRVAAYVRTPVVDAQERRYEPPQVQSGASVRYAARPTPAIIPATAPADVPDVQPDLARIRLADAAAVIRQRAVAESRRRRRLTLTAIVMTTLLVLLGAATFTAFAITTW